MSAFLSLVLAGPLAATAQESGLDVPFQKVELENGLTVVLHADHSDPVVAVYVSYHVGSAREEPGRSGFAHLFEHMLFQGSQHVGDDQHFKYVSEAGGTLNGTTNRDRTLYFETLPANQLELALWLEADRMGFLLPAVTQEKLDNQRDVVRNERRQNYENRPYGQIGGAIAAALFPPDHPYSWLTIGSHADLEAATLDDVHAFFRRWYGPNNATLAIGGDIDPEATLALVERYFGPIPRGPAVERPAPRPVALEAEVRLVQEDDVRLPQLDLAWAGTVQHGPDDAVLDLLAMILSESRASVLDRALTIDELLARRVSASNRSGELAGTFEITVTAAPGVDLDALERKVRDLLAELAERGIDPEQLQRMKNRYESDFVRRLETVSARTAMLAESETYTGDPGHFETVLERHLAVTPEAVRAALQRYLIDAPAVVASVVPRGERGLAASGRTPEQIAAERAFDRAARPGAGPAATFRSPEIWHETLDNGLAVHGTPYRELPLTTLSLSLPAGRLHEPREKLGIASMTAALMNEGTRSLSTTELADRLDYLGANLSVGADDDEISVGLSVLDKHLPAALRLLADVLLEPRLDPADFERLKTQRLIAIDSRAENIRGIAGTAWDRLLYGPETVAGLPSAGTRATVEALTLDDVKAYHAAALAGGGGRIAIATGLSPAEVRGLLVPLVERWPAGAARAGPALASVPKDGATDAAGKLFLIDKPGAAQSEIRIGHLSVSSLDDDWWALQVLNYPIGGSFSSRVNMNLREDKGYTYGARTRFSGGLHPAPFTASAGVQTEVTAPSVRELLKELEAAALGVTADELAFAQAALEQSEVRSYESARARLGLVDAAAKYGWPDDYVEERLAALEGFTTEGLRALAQEHIVPERMTILVVGDKSEVLEGLLELGRGPVIELDVDGVPLAGEE